MIMGSRVELTKAFLVYCPPSHEQYYRPYEGILNGDTLRAISHHTEGGHLINGSSLMDVASSIIRPVSTPVAPVPIVNGFGIARFAFFLEFTSSESSLFSGTEREIVTGFTDHIGVDSNGNLNPNMYFYINNRQIIRNTNMQVGHNGFNPHAAVFVNQSILPRNTGPCNKAMRPEDVGGSHYLNIEYSGMQTFDTRSDLSLVPLAAPKDASTSLSYMNNLLNGYRKSIETVPIDEKRDFFNEVIGTVRTTGLSTSPFLNAMRGTGGVDANAAVFSAMELLNTWPRNKDFFNISLPNPNKKMSSPIENTERWNTAQIEADIAFNLTHAFPAIMSNMMLVSLKLEMTNQTLDGQPQVAIIHAQSMFDYAIDSAKMNFIINKIKYDIIRGVIMQRVPSFYISADINLFRNNYMNVSVNGGISVPFCAPMYCDSFYSPLNGSAYHLNSITDNIDCIVSQFINSGSFSNQSQHRINETYQQADISHNDFNFSR